MKIVDAAGRYIFRNGTGVAEFIRFCIIGTLAAAVHYGVYYLLLLVGVNVNISYAAGYIISFIGNFFATSRFTFRTKPSWGRFAGFAGSHGINFLLHMVLLNVFLHFGMHRLIAPIVVMLVAMAVQFIILHFVFHFKKS